MAAVPDVSCSIARSLGVLGERWTLLILRDAFEGMTRFADFRASLGVASDVLSDRLATLVEHGVLTKVDYQEPGERRRAAYELTDAGRELFVVLGALQEWGDRHLPWAYGPSLERRDRRSGQAVHTAFVREDGREVAPADVEFAPTASYPRDRLAARERREAARASAAGAT
jgi:DNA-binding HxlR family transcriptional regulator